eukprot:4897891-Pyramimonas_sp.AAC.1
MPPPGPCPPPGHLRQILGTALLGLPENVKTAAGRPMMGPIVPQAAQVSLPTAFKETESAQESAKRPPRSVQHPRTRSV